jgi:putative NADPH-quinone reductase
LVIVAHPALPLSKPDLAMVQTADVANDVVVRDLYSLYQAHPIDVPAERAFAAAADDIVVHFPVLHHHAPPLLQQWLQRVFDPVWFSASGAEVLFAGTGFGLSTVVEEGSSSSSVRRLQQWRVEEQSRFLRHWSHRLGMRWRAPVVLSIPAHPSERELVKLQEAYRRVLLEPGEAADALTVRRRRRPAGQHSIDAAT